MRLNSRTRLLLLLLTAIVVLPYAIISSFPVTPQYQGKTFYQWASELHQAHDNHSDPGRSNRIELASNAIRAMGTNVWPGVRADLKGRLSLENRFLNWLAPRAPFARIRAVQPRDLQMRGTYAMQALGPLGKPFLPEIITMVSNGTGYFEGALVAIGPDSLPAFTNLLVHSEFPHTGFLAGWLSSAVSDNRITREQAAVAVPYLIHVLSFYDSHARWQAVGALATIRRERELCVPALIKGLSDLDEAVRQVCVLSLGAFGEDAAQHVGEVVDAFSKMDVATRRSFCAGSGNLRAALRIYVPVLARAAADSDVSVRVEAVTALGRLATLPETEVPTPSEAILPILNHALSDPDGTVRSTAAAAIHRYDDGVRM